MTLDERCYEVYNIQVHGLMKRLHGDGDREGGDRRVGRAGFDAGVDRGGAHDGSAGAAAHQCAGLYHARVCHQPHRRTATRIALMEALGVQRARDRHPPFVYADVA